MQVNFRDMDIEKSFSLYPSGAYLVRIKSIEETTASTGNDQLRIKTEILNPTDMRGKQLTDHITLLESVAWKLGKFIAGCGMDIKALGSMDTKAGSFRTLLNKLINKTTVWIVDQKTDRDGNLRNVVTDYQPDPNAGHSSKDDPDFLKEQWDEEKK